MLAVDGPLDQRGEIVHAEVTRRRRHDGLCIDKKMIGKAASLEQAGSRLLVLECQSWPWTPASHSAKCTVHEPNN